MEQKKIIVGLAAIAAIVGGAYWWQTWSTSDADPFAKVKTAMRADAAGGATPAETLGMFVAALRANDVAAAAQLFMLDDSGSRAKWEKRLTDLHARGMFARMADDIEQAAQPASPAYEGDARYELFNDDGTLGAVIDMELNTFSGVWKLQSL